MKKANIYTLAIVLFVLCTCTYVSGEDSITLPLSSWKIGDSWKVRSWRHTGGLMRGNKDSEYKPPKLDKEKPFTVNFEVLSVKSLSDFNIPYTPRKISERVKYDKLVKDGTIKKGEIKCFEVRVTFPESTAGFQERYLLYFQREMGNLIRVLNVSKRPDDTIVNTRTDYPLDPNGPVIATTIFSSIPFDWPNWKKEQITVEDEETKKRRQQEIKEKNMVDIKGEFYDGYEITMKLIDEKKESEKLLVKTVQNWRANGKWWEKIKRYNERDEIVAEAVLLRE